MTTLHMREDISSHGRIFDFDFDMLDRLIDRLPEQYRYRGLHVEKGRPFLVDIENRHTQRRNLYLMDSVFETLIPIHNLYEGDEV